MEGVIPLEKYHAAVKRMKQKTKTGKGEKTGDGFRSGSGVCFSAVHEKWCGMTLDGTMAERGNRKQQLLKNKNPVFFIDFPKNFGQNLMMLLKC